MREHKRNIKISRISYQTHIIMYTLAILFLINVAWDSKDTNFYISVGLLIFYGLSLLVDSLAVVKDGDKIAMRQVIFFAYRCLHFVAAGLLIFMKANYYTSLAGGVFMIGCILETWYRFDFEDMMKRFIFYFVISISFITPAFMWTLSDRNNTLEDHFQLIVSGIMILVLIVWIGEVVVKIWDYFMHVILKQRRAFESLEEENKEIKEQQEKVSKVNELLGMQKVQLQIANQKIHNAHQESAIQNDVARSISTSLDLELMTENVCQILYEKTELDYIAIMLEPIKGLNEDNEFHASRTIAYRTRNGDKFALNIWKDVQKGVYDHLLEIQHTYIETLGREGRMIENLQSFVSVPLKRHGQRVGNLLIGRNEPESFKHSVDFYDTIGHQISLGLTNSILYQQMEEMAIRDGLTGIYNRRYLAEVLQAKMAEAKRNHTSVSLALFDIDKFKIINDTFGHPFGDVVIKYVASLLEKAANEHHGMAGRYGGEEFVIAFPGKSLDEAYKIVKQIHEEIREAVIEVDDMKADIRVSAGIAAYPETCSKVEDVLTRADWAMYHSKRNGRDQITVDSENISSEM